MNSGQLQKSVQDVASAHPEVEFALVLARTIDAVKADPEQLRSAVYELARHKLLQLSDEDPAEKARLMHALEVAIAGVEAHTKDNLVGRLQGPTVPMNGPRLEPPASPLLVGRAAEASAPLPPPPSLVDDKQERQWHASMPLRFAAIVVFFLAVAGIFAVQRRGVGLAGFRTAVAHIGRPDVKSAESVQPAAPKVDQKPSR